MDTSSVRQKALRFGENRIVQLTNPSLLLTAYAISKQAAQKYIPAIFPVADAMDLEIARVWAHGVEIHELLPFCVQPSGAETTTGEMKDAKSLTRTLRRLPFRLETRIFRAGRFGWRAVTRRGLQSMTIRRLRSRRMTVWRGASAGSRRGNGP